MSFDPPLQALFDALRAAEGAGGAPTEPAEPAEPVEPVDIATERAQADATMVLIRPPVPEGVEVSEHDVPVDDGAASIRVRIHRPAGLPAAAPTVVFIHGGGWMQGNLDTAEVESGPIATAVPCMVVSVGYRLAPEHPFPTPLEDCVAAYRWVHDNASALGVDPARVAVAGGSAGGNLAAAVCLAARDRELPMPVVQLLDVPALDLTLSSPSIHDPDAQAGLTGAAVKRYAQQYLAGHPATDPLASPLLATDLSGLPPAVVLVAEHDPVRDDGERWVRALHAAGVAASGYRVLTHFHGGWFIPFTVTSRLAQDLRAAALRRAFDGTLVP